MAGIDDTARELIRELPKVLLKTGDSKIDYLASNVLAEIVRDLRTGHISRTELIKATLLDLNDSLTDWRSEPRQPEISEAAGKVCDLALQFSAETEDAKVAV
ncbi:MAG: hypothetical protein WAM05_10515 [Candidatus Binataceae bacterium]